MAEEPVARMLVRYERWLSEQRLSAATRRSYRRWVAELLEDLAGGDPQLGILGGRGADVLRGGGGADELRGNRGPDELHGGPGDDVLVGGLGPDIEKGGSGSDSCSEGDDTQISC